MADRGFELTEKALAELEKKIAGVYQKAVSEVQDKLDDYLRRFETKDKIKQEQVAAGKITQAEYTEWRTGQLMMGKRWESLRNELAEDLHRANETARDLVNRTMPDVYAQNHNYASYAVEHATKLDTSYTLYDKDAVARIVRDDPALLPPPGARMKARIAAGQDVAWQEGQLQSTILQGIVQGESIPNLSKRIAREMGETNHKATIRYARTSVTAAQNAGRLDAYTRASDMGIKMQQTWVATLDNRTRHEHRMLDGQTVDIDEPFVVEGEKIRYPGDPAAAPHLIWNCRCTTIAQIKGYPRDLTDTDLRHDAHLGRMTYDEWLEDKATSHSITKQEEIAREMERRTIREDYRR